MRIVIYIAVIVLTCVMGLYWEDVLAECTTAGPSIGDLREQAVGLANISDHRRYEEGLYRLSILEKEIEELKKCQSKQ